MPESAETKPTSPSLLRPFLLVFLAAALIRLVWAANAHVTPISDFYGYDITAMHWLETGEYRYLGGNLLAYRTPGYMAFLAAIYAIVGHSPWTVGLVQAVMGGLSAGLLVILAGRTVSPRVGLISGLLFAVWPVSVVYVPCLASGNLAVLLLIAGLTCLVAAHRTTGLRQSLFAIASGLCYGGLFLTRASMVFLLPAWFLLAVLDPMQRRWRPRTFVLCALAAAATISPWLIRSHRVGLGFTTFSTQGGYALWWGNNWQTRDGGTGAPPRFPGDRQLSELEQHRFFRQKAIEWIRENPGRYLDLCRVRLVRILGKQGDLWAAKYLLPTAHNDAAIAARYQRSRGREYPEELAAYARQIESRNLGLHESFRLVVAPLVLLSILLALWRPRAFAFVLLPLVCYLAGHSLTAFAARYRMVSDPLVLVPLAALLADLLFGSRELCPRLWRWAKALLAASAVAASLWVHHAGVDRGWYVLPPSQTVLQQQPEFDASLGDAVEIDVGSTANMREVSTRSCDFQRIETTDGLRYNLRGTPDGSGHQYGGVVWPVPGLAAARAELSFSNPDNIEAVFVEGRDADGKCRLRWAWQEKDGTTLPEADEPVIYVFVPNERARVFRATRKDTSVPVTDFRILVRIHRNTHAGFTLRNLTIAVPTPPEATQP